MGWCLHRGGSYPTSLKISWSAKSMALSPCPVPSSRSTARSQPVKMSLLSWSWTYLATFTMNDKLAHYPEIIKKT